jgi:type II secretory pathway pseudopilin PulG
MAPPREERPRRPEREAGLTLVEVVIAVLVLVIGSFATFGVLRAATVNDQRAKATQVALNRAQQEIEALRNLSNEQLALTSTPPHSADPLNPDYRVNITNSTFALTREPPGSYASMVVEGGSLYGGGFVKGGVVTPEEPFSSGGVSGEVYRYVVWRNDTSCGASCPGEQDYKQIVVAVKLDKQANESAERGYVEVQSNFIEPSKNAESDPIPPEGGKVNSPQQLFLSDTSCSGTGTTVRQSWEEREAIGDHPLHNTLGTCASGLQTGTTAGAPDALLLGSPPDPTPTEPATPPLYDYSNDYSGEITLAETAKGIQLIPHDSGGCGFEPSGSTQRRWQVHRWVTDPMPFQFTMAGAATLDFFTRSLNELAYSGTLCIYLFDRHESGGNPEDSTLLNSETGNPYWTFSEKGNGQWPRNGEWTEVRVPMSFAETSIPAGDRLGVELGINGNSDPGAVPILYDHPDYRTRIEIETPTPLGTG